jgi:putative membrane protein
VHAASVDAFVYNRRMGSQLPNAGARDRLAAVAIAVLSSAVIVGVALVMATRPAAGAALDVSWLPLINALLNASSALLLLAGYAFIRRRRVTAHLRCMLGAFALSALFLVSYVVYHARAGSRPYGGHGATRAIYFVLLISHVILAGAILPLALTTLHRAWRGEFARHVRIARRTLPVWLYVSVTGVVIYVMLYHLSSR